MGLLGEGHWEVTSHSHGVAGGPTPSTDHRQHMCLLKPAPSQGPLPKSNTLKEMGKEDQLGLELKPCAPASMQHAHSQGHPFLSAVVLCKSTSSGKLSGGITGTQAFGVSQPCQLLFTYYY